MRTIVDAARRRRWIVIVTTGMAVDVPLGEGAASQGHTVHSAWIRLAYGHFELGPFDVFIVDETGMVQSSTIGG